MAPVDTAAAPAPAGTAAAPTAPAAPAVSDGADRGTLTIAPVVVRKVAEHAADSTPGTARTTRTLGLGQHGATAEVDGDGPGVDVRLELALNYPAAVRAVADAVRAKVTEDVERITGYRVRGVSVVVTGLVPPTHNRVE
ncbi:Asp23/Gls24 family envelope stress response protein [Actinokineospora guangxiensis]|uniref:Asp23/Gls24 family envelope stress response protein n=1 Tax=Actinokineospora guangxiensis TaxID=1490288 RepID=A0ABW0EPA4_9PSEU